MLPDIIKSFVLGAVEGLTEFLPVSSTGHLILVNQWIHFSEPFTTTFDIVIQLGAILAVVVYFWQRLWPFGKDAVQRNEIIITWLKTVVGVVPALVLGGLLGEWIEKKLFNPWVVAIALVFGGLILLGIEKNRINSRFDSIVHIPWKIAFYIGLAQCLSMIPGTSRSAATIIGALLLGVSRVAAVEFSFFLAIPTMVAATAYRLLKHGMTMNNSEIVLLTVGFASAFFVALVVIKFFVNYIKRHDFTPFGYYRLTLGGFILIYFLLK